MKSLRVLTIGGFISYRALFNWLRPSIYVFTTLVPSVTKLCFFVFLGRAAHSGSDAFYVAGNALVVAASPCIFGMAQTIAGERYTQTLSLLVVSPANRVAIFLGRALPATLNGFVVSVWAFTVGSLLFGVSVPGRALAPLALTIALAALSCVGIGLFNAALGLRWRETGVLGNIVLYVLLLFAGVNIPLDRLPGWLATISEGLPVTHAARAARDLVAGSSRPAAPRRRGARRRLLRRGGPGGDPPLRGGGASRRGTGRGLRSDYAETMNEPDDMRALVETLPLVVYTATLDEKVKPLFIAPQVEELLGIPPDEFTFGRLLACIHPEDRDEVAHRFREADRNREDLTIEYRWVRPDGRMIWLEDASRVVDVHGEPVAQGYLLDVTQRKQTELALARRTEGRQHLAALGRQSLEGASRDVIVHGALQILRDDVDADTGAILERAPAGLVVVDAFGWDAVGKVALEGTPAFTALQERRTITGPTTLASDESLLARTGMKSTVAAPILGENSDVFGVVAVHSRLEDAFDESQVALVEQIANLIAAVVLRERSDARTQMSQRLEAVGQLAAGVAHDFNNMLTVISGYAGFALNHVDSTGRQQLEHVLHAAERAGSLTAQLLAFSRRQTLHRRPIRLADTVGAVLPMLRTMLGENIAVVEHVGGAVVLADQAQLENVLVNLALNARDAMPDGGMLTIGCETVEIDDLEAEVQEVEPGGYGVLSVADTGVGMSEEVLARVFEPFFTTKGPGEGTGLGLAGVYGTIRQSGGFVDAESEPGVGTTFRVHLPLADAAGAVVTPHPELEPPFVRGRVLLVEDEDIVRSLLAEQLVNAGHDVVAAGTAGEALDVLAAERVDALVTDVGLPGTNGATLADTVRRLHPGVGVILISGYPGDLVGASPSLVGVQLLQKPFTSRELQQALASVLH